MPKEEKRPQKEEKPYTKRGGPVMGHGEVLRRQVEALKNDPKAKAAPAPTAARRRLMEGFSLQTT